MKELQINKEFRDLLPSLTKDEYDLLEILLLLIKA